ncbi:MAG: acetylornithine transaminase [Limnochordaceae bacterium]|nr:acetylornithine transaminase [Limnochordaceae bacterium]
MSDQYLLPTYTRQPLVLVRGEGAQVWDVNGRVYLDFVGGIAVALVGHCHPQVVSAVQQQAAELIHTSNLFYTEPAARLAARLAQQAQRAGLKQPRLFFANSGTEAVEAALKLARRFAAVVKGEPGRYEIISALGSFHGRTMGALAATGQEKYQRDFRPLPEGFRYVPYNDAAALGRAISEKTAAVILEAVQGEGGVRPADPGYLQAARRLTRERGALLILDEVQTGLGRTGSFFAFEQAGIQPDLICLAKGLGGGLPIGALIAAAPASQGFAPGSHASTFGGNPLACRAALAVLDVLEQEQLVKAAQAKGERLYQGLAALAQRFGLAQARGVGLMQALDLGTEAAAQVVDLAREEGLLVNAVSPTTLRLLPPLVTSSEQIQEALGALERALTRWRSSL